MLANTQSLILEHEERYELKMQMVRCCHKVVMVKSLQVKEQVPTARCPISKPLPLLKQLPQVKLPLLLVSDDDEETLTTDICCNQQWS